MGSRERTRGLARADGQLGSGEMHMDFPGFSGSFFQTLETKAA